MSDDVKEFVRQLEIQNAKLDDIIAHGSRNFRRYRRRAMVVLVLLSLTNAAALYWQWDTQRSTAKAAKAACERSREFGPALVDGLERQRTVPPDVIRFYRRTIPKVCPK
jgi:hypothetical protein